MIAYFDTSAIVPLLVLEPTTDLCTRLWNEAERVVTCRLAYPETRAALASAHRAGRLSGPQLRGVVAELDSSFEEVDILEVDDRLARIAGDLAERHALRGYDAVHLAAALAIADADLVFVTGDTDLGAAATDAGLAVARMAR
mgnify:CR=1 FL=1